MASMYSKSLAGFISVNCSVSELGVEMPEMVWLFWKLAMFAAVGALDFFAKNAASALQYDVSPAIVLS
jgi:hypothetical protein